MSYDIKGKPDLVIKDFNKVIELKPDDAEAYKMRGIAYNKKGEPDLAIQDFNKAMEIKSDYADAYNGRGVALGIKGKHDLAAQDFGSAIQLAPKTYHSLLQSRNRLATSERMGKSQSRPDGCEKQG